MTESLTNYPSKLCHEPNPSRVPPKCDSIACEKYHHPKRPSTPWCIVGYKCG